MIRAEVTVRCIGIGGAGCGAAVDPERGGAWCRRCRPLDLTGGVSPWDAPRPSVRGYAPTARAAHGQVPSMLEAAGWERVTYGTGTRWRDPATGFLYSQDYARRRAFCAPDAPTRRHGDEDYARWAVRYRRGESCDLIARDERVSCPALVRHHLRRLGVPLRPPGRVPAA